MRYTKLPSVWRIGDFIAFGLGAVVCIGFLIYGLLVGAEGPRQWPFIMAATAAGFAFVYWQVIRMRQADLRGFVLAGNPRYGLLVNMGHYEPAGESIETLTELIDEVVTGWSKVWPLSVVETAVNCNYIWVWFKPGDLDLPRNMPGKVAGFTVGRIMVVGYKAGSTFERTAFRHELGHVIQGTVTGDWDQATHHRRAKDNGLW